MSAITIDTIKKMDVSAISRLSVVGDHEVDSWVFSLPKTHAGTSLPTTGWGVGYELSDGSGDIDEQVVVAITELALTVTYKPSGGIVSKAGQVTLWLQCVQDGAVAYQTIPSAITVVRKPIPTTTPDTETFLDRAVQAAADAQAVLVDENFVAVAAITDEIATVAGMTEDVATVAVISEDVSKVAAIDTAVGLVAVVDDSVVKVAAIDTDVTKVAAIDTAVSAVALNESNITAVAGNKDNIDLVAGEKANIDILAPIADDVGTVALVAGAVSAVAALDDEVAAVAAIGSDVEAVADNSVNVTAVAGNKTNIDAAVANATNINAVNANKTNIDAVAGNKSNIDTVAGASANINAVATSIANVNTVGGSIANVNAVAADATDIGTVATDLALGASSNIKKVAAIDSSVQAVAAVDTAVSALGAKTTEIDALYAELDAIGAKATVDSVDDLAGTGRTIETVKGNADAIATLETTVDTNRLYSDSQYLDLKAKYEAQQIALNASKAELYTDDPILQYGATEIIGDGYEADDTPIDVSANVVDGSLEMEQKGLTIRNRITPPTSITPSFASLNAGTPTVSAGEITFTVTAQNGHVRYEPTDLITGNVYFISVLVKSSTAFVELNRAGTSLKMVHSGSGNFERLYILRTASSNTDQFRVQDIGDGSTSGQLWNQIQAKEWEAINLTALGLSTITDTDILSKMLPYVDGTKAVGKMGMRVVGVNLANKLINGAVLISDGKMIVDNTFSMIFARVHEGMVVSGFSNAGVGNVFGFYTDDNITVNSITYNGSRTVAATTNITVPSNQGIKWIGVRIAYNPTTFQINLGSTALPYEPYQEQLTFLPAIGNSLPNGVADSIKTVADGWEHTKRVSDRTLLNVEYFNALQTNADNVVAYGNANFQTSVGGVEDSNGISFETYTKSPNTNLDAQTASDIGRWTISGTRRLGFVFASGTTLAQAKTALANTYFIYQLATPITTHYDLPLPTSGKTIHRFAGEEKISLYGTGVTFTENVLSVLSAVKFVAGEMTDITSLATITGATVTFSGVSATDVVYVKVEHDVDRPLGVLEHTPAVSNTASRLAALEAAVFGG